MTGEVERLRADLRATRTQLAVKTAELDRVSEAQRRQHEQLQALHETTSAVLTAADVDAVLGRVRLAVARAFPAAERVSILLGALPLEGPVGKVASQRQPLLLNEENGVELHSRGLRLPEGEPVLSAAIAPLVRYDEPVGVLVLTSAQLNALSESDLWLLEAHAALATAALTNAQAHAQAQVYSLTDPLTSLLNHHGLLDVGEREVARALRYSRPLAALAIDIDHLRRVNEAHGHEVGDQVLSAVAGRCRRLLRPQDSLGRYGGEVFAALLLEAGPGGASLVGERLRRAVAAVPIVTTAGQVNVTVSCGVAALGAQTRTIDALLDGAEEAMHAAKSAGRNCVRIVDEPV